MVEHFELLDLWKALAAILAGLILGFEREIKDKSAGLKTITIICLGSTLFSILSYKVSGSGDPTRIASYIVTGIGFLGAGVIYKEGFSVYGLTTAGIIWMASAVGMAIGFGEISIAFTFLISALVIIYCTEYLSSRFLPQHHNRILKFKISPENFFKKNSILADIRKISREATEMALEKKEADILITLDLHISDQEIEKLEVYLMANQDLEYFSY